MSKSILVIDTPDNCWNCPLIIKKENGCRACLITNCTLMSRDNKFLWCPLKLMPEPYDLTIPCSDPHYEQDFECGYNQCIEDFLNGDQNDSWPEYRVEIIGEQK